jgi:predicted HicB family RNase H-like nuclease
MATPQRTVKKLSVLLPANLHRRAKRQALLSDQSLTDLIITLLSNHLDSADREEALQQAASKSDNGLQ